MRERKRERERQRERQREFKNTAKLNPHNYGVPLTTNCTGKTVKLKLSKAQD